MSLLVALDVFLLVPSVSLCVPLCDRPCCCPSGLLDLHRCFPSSPGVLTALLAVVALVAISAIGLSLPARTVEFIFLVRAVGAGGRIRCFTGDVVVCSARLTVER